MEKEIQKIQASYSAKEMVSAFYVLYIPPKEIVLQFLLEE